MRLRVRTAPPGAAVWITFLLGVGAASAQTLPGPVEEAERLRNAGQLEAAVRVLERHLTGHPDDVTAALKLAQTLYWLQEPERARQLYEAALRRHPGEGWVRLEYGRMLLETGDRRRSRALVVPLLENPALRGHASALLGTLAYWEGDLASAQRLFRAAIAAGADTPDVRRQLQEIRAVSASWIQVAPAIWHDDQPLDRAGALIGAGWFLTPLVPVQVRFEPMRYTRDGTSRAVWAGDARLAAYVPSARFDLEGQAGFLRRSEPEPSTDWTWRLSAGPRLGHGVTMRGRLERAPYLNTAASLDTRVMLTTLAAGIRIDNPQGWLGEAEHRHQRYFDDNIVRTSYAWLLAPLFHDRLVTVQAGYAVARSDSDELRFVLVSTRPPLGFQELDGRYDPYHTPLDELTHSALAALRISSAGGTTVRASGSYGFRAEEDFPLFMSSAGQVRLTLDRRSFRPWTGRGSLEFRANDGTTVTVAGEAGRTAFYRWATAGLQVTYRFGVSGR